MLAVLGGVRDAVGDRLGHRARPHLAALDVQTAADVAAVGAAEHAHRQLGAPGAHQAGDADDLTGAHVQRGPVDHQAVLGGVPHRPVLDPQHLLAGGDVAGRVEGGQVAPDHAADDPVLGRAAVGHVERLDGAAVADDGGRVGDRRDLTELVRDHDAGDALVAEAAHQVQQVRRVDVVERRCGLVEDQQPHLLGQRLGDLHQLLLADAQLDDRGDRVLVQPDRPQQRRGLGVGAVPVDEPAAAPALVAEEDVLGDRQVRHQREFLVDDDDAARFAVLDAPEADRLAVQDDLAVVAARRVDPGQHLHQGGLPGAVLAADRVDLAAPYGERDVLQRGDPGEGLRDATHLEDVVAHGYPSCSWSWCPERASPAARRATGPSARISRRGRRRPPARSGNRSRSGRT